MAEILSVLGLAFSKFIIIIELLVVNNHLGDCHSVLVSSASNDSIITTKIRPTLKCYNCTWINPGVKGQLDDESYAREEGLCNSMCVIDATMGVCVKEVVKVAGVIRSVKRFCAASTESGACFEHSNREKSSTIICLCNDWQSCNIAAPSIPLNLSPISFVIFILLSYIFTYQYF